MSRFVCAFGLAALLGSSAFARAADPAKKPGDKPATEKAAEKSKDEDSPKDHLSETKHTARIGGGPLAYTATAGNLVMRDEEGKAKANFFFVAYTRDGVEDRGHRPVTFTFNGGPGSSSVWLHLGALGPRRVKLNPEPQPTPPPYELVDNESSILDLTDLVFIDPVTTGYSRAVPVDEDAKYHGVNEDIRSVGDFIRLYTTRFGRWASPKFLAGESYGTTRAAGLSGYLQGRYGMYLNGIVLISAVLDFSTDEFQPGNDLPFVCTLPTYTATAWYHHKLPADLQADLQKALQESEAFAKGEYNQALMQGNDLPEADRHKIAEKLARLTGLSKAYVERTHLRIVDERFYKELLRDQGRVVGRLDARFLGKDLDDAGEAPDGDPSYSAIQGPFTAMLNDYVRRDLKYESDLPYEILTGRVHPWSFKDFENKYVNVAETLRQAMGQNPSLRVFVANGYYDFATPFFATAYTLAHMGLSAEQTANVHLGYYEAGHMMYIHPPSMLKLKEDLTAFYRWAAPAPTATPAKTAAAAPVK